MSCALWHRWKAVKTVHAPGSYYSVTPACLEICLDCDATRYEFMGSKLTPEKWKQLSQRLKDIA